jgi:hypothetical protein
MSDRWRNFHRTNTLTLLAIAAAITFNNWLLLLVFNRSLLFSGAAVSAFSLSGQSHATWLQILDILSGFLFIVIGLIVTQKKVPKHILIAVTIIILGVSNVLDAVFPIKCTRGCEANLVTTFSHVHTYTSILITFTLLALPLMGWLYAKEQANKKFLFSSLGTLLYSVFSVLFALFIFWHNRSFSAQGYGPIQEIQMFIFGIWLVHLCSLIAKQNAMLASNLQQR